ncbi:MAG: hypothetical protein K2N85_11100 [Lachnospiraceae bacterium]|nr:hypothetical protein [Lachnospiraceae bacterium]
MKDTITILTAYKDLFWIIFTLAATIISILTYINVRRSIKQSLYDNILKVQLEAYEVLLQELKENNVEYLFSLDLENMMKFNLISHLVDKGVIQNMELCDNIYNIYMIMKDDESEKAFIGEELFQNLEEINEITVLIGEDFVGEEVAKEKESLKEKVRKRFHKGFIGKYILTDIRGLLLNTPKSEKAHHVIYRYTHNVYLPRRILSKLKNFEKAYMGVVPGTMYKIIYREEDKIFRGKGGERITINFDKMFNELIADKSTKSLFRKYNGLKREIRKSLKIDAHW